MAHKTPHGNACLEALRTSRTWSVCGSISKEDCCVSAFGWSSQAEACRLATAAFQELVGGKCCPLVGSRIHAFTVSVRRIDI
eukprot:6489249-Amphidinium_carterae.1